MLIFDESWQTKRLNFKNKQRGQYKKKFEIGPKVSGMDPHHQEKKRNVCRVQTFKGLVLKFQKKGQQKGTTVWLMSYISESHFFTIIDIWNCGFTLGYNMIVHNVIGEQTYIWIFFYLI